MTRAYLVLIMTFLSACGNGGADISVDVVDMTYEKIGGGPSLVFELKLTNNSPTELTGYGFLYAKNGEAYPPTIGIFPLGGVVNLTRRSRMFSVTDHTKGMKITLSPGEPAEFNGAIIVPTRWHDGTPIEATIFKEFRLIIYDKSEVKVFDYSFGTTGRPL